MFGIPVLWLAGAAVAAVLLAGSHWKAYVAGEHSVQDDWDAAKVQLAQAQIREVERQGAINERIGYDLETARRAAVDAGALSARRLRDLSAARSASAAACARLDEPAAAVLPEGTRIDLESLADRADEAARALGGWQQRQRELATGEGIKVKP